MTMTQNKKPLPKRNTGEIRGFEAQYSREGRVKTSAGYNANLHSWVQAEHSLKNGRTYFSTRGSCTITPQNPITMEYEMEDYEVQKADGSKETKQKAVRDEHGSKVVKTISLISPTEWFAHLMKGSFKQHKSKQVPRLDASGNQVVINGIKQTTYKSFYEHRPVTVQTIISYGNNGVRRLVNDLKVMVHSRLGYPFVNYITSGNQHHSNCRYYGAKTPWGQVQGGDFNKNYEYNTHYYKRSNQVQVMGQLDKTFMDNFEAWVALSEDLEALANVDQIASLKRAVESNKQTYEANKKALQSAAEKWTEEYMMEYARKERDSVLAQRSQAVKWARENLERTQSNLERSEERETTSVTAMQKKHFGKVFRKVKVTNDE